ncbi:MAG TPA: ATP-binding protein [Actinomycetota bacterium]|nr:ATP-binding protein [Actinomycetota bacterium]
MSGIGSTLRRHWIELAWGAFALANVAAIVVLSRWETIPFHLVWVSLTLVYGFRVWGSRATGVALALVVAVTGAALAWTVIRADEGLDEVVEVPLMAAMFLGMVWHARRRQVAIEEAGRRADREHRLLERQREFIRDASHELRTPITVARGHAELLRASVNDPQGTADVEVVLDELARLSYLSERLLILAAAEHPAILGLGRVPIVAFLDDMARRWGPAADRRWLVSSEADGWVTADAQRLGVAFDALVENAVNATGPGGRIELRARRRDGSVVLEVADSGLGIAPDRLPGLFERFSRLDGHRDRRSGGTGLGLAIVRAVAEAHRGTAEAESVPGEGSRFRIVLPGFEPREVVGGAPPPSA